MNLSTKVKPPKTILSQDCVFKFLKAQISEQTDHITTHCAHIFLIGDFAFKVKTAVKYSYLDMSSLEQRKKLCEREFELNSPILPSVYLDVLPITIDDENQLAINGNGRTVEWALKMRRFPQDRILDNVAFNGGLDIALAKELGQSLAEYHIELPSTDASDGYLRIVEVYQELLYELNKLECVFGKDTIELFSKRCKIALAKSQEHLNKRALEGFIKRCHGDLHLRNILLTSLGPKPFDALEFDERMATTDVLYDLAYLLMDMMHRDMPEQTNTVLNNYLLHSAPAQCAGIAHLPLFLSLRAAIRAMTSAQAANQQIPADQNMLADARQYLDESNAFLTKRATRLIAIGGFSGSGKSSVASELAHRVCKAPGAILLRSDTERKKLAGIAETSHLPTFHYTVENSQRVYRILLKKAQMALIAGATVIVDSVFHEQDLRVQIQEIAYRNNVQFSGLWLEAPTPILEERISRRINDASDADITVLRQQLTKATGYRKWAHIDASGSLNETVENALRELEI